MRFLRQSLIGLFLTALTLALMVYAGSLVRGAVQERMSQEARTPNVRERVFAVNVVPATFETITPVLTAFGEVQSQRTLEIRAASGGAMMDFAPEFQEGGRVTEGQLLARTDPANALSALDRVKSQMLDAEAEAREANRALILAQDELQAAVEQSVLRDKALERQVNLQERGVGTAAAVETAELAASTARQQILSRRQAVAQAEARIDQAVTLVARQDIALAEAERALKNTEIRADFTGTLSDVNVVEGRLVSANEQLAQLVDASALEVAFRVSTQQYSRLLAEDGTLQRAKVTATLDAFSTNLTAKGVLVRDGVAVGEGQTGRLLFASLSESRGFKPGDFVTVSIEEAALPFVARLPASAVNAAGEVLVIGAEDRLEMVKVTVERRQGNDVLVRSRELRDKEVVAERTPLLGAGIKVRPLRGEGAVVPEPPKMVQLTQERRDKLIAFVESNGRMPSAVKERILSQLKQDQVPAEAVERLESRMGG